MTRKKTDVMEWMDEVLGADPDLAKAVEERLDEMRREQDEAERSPEYPSRSARREKVPKVKEPISKELALAAAKKLSPGSWGFLFDQLFADIELEPDPEIEAAWLAEAERRLREADESCWIPAEVVFAEIRRSLNRPRKPRPPIVVNGVAVPVPEVIESCCALPIAERVALAEWYLSREETSGTKRHTATWLEDSTRWLAKVRAKLGNPVSSASLAKSPERQGPKRDREGRANNKPGLVRRTSRKRPGG
jgi:hypothetical protein